MMTIKQLICELQYAQHEFGEDALIDFDSNDNGIDIQKIVMTIKGNTDKRSLEEWQQDLKKCDGECSIYDDVTDETHYLKTVKYID